jgi:hypothetical protein
VEQPAIAILNLNRIMTIATRHPYLTDLAPPQSSEVATMARCRHVSVLDYTQGLGHTASRHHCGNLVHLNQDREPVRLKRASADRAEILLPSVQ